MTPEETAAIAVIVAGLRPAFSYGIAIAAPVVGAYGVYYFKYRRFATRKTNERILTIDIDDTEHTDAYGTSGWRG